MPFRILCCLAAAVLVGAPRLGASSPHIDDPGRLATADEGWSSEMESRLAAFEAGAGIRIVLQFHPKSPPEAEDKLPGAYMRGLASGLGVIRGGVLVVFFADDPDWRVWVGDELTPRFVGKPGNAKQFTESGQMHNAKEAFLSAALAKADAAFAALQRAAPPGRPPDPGRHRDLQADALIEGLIAKLGPL
jgi:hypothetical protein